MYVNFRNWFHNFMRGILTNWLDAMASKQEIQIVLLVLLLLGFCLVVPIAIASSMKTSPANRLLWSGAGLVSMVALLEMISLHKVDAGLYSFAGPFMIVAWIYFLASMLTTTGALWLHATDRKLKKPLITH